MKFSNAEDAKFVVNAYAHPAASQGLQIYPTLLQYSKLLILGNYDQSLSQYMYLSNKWHVSGF